MPQILCRKILIFFLNIKLEKTSFLLTITNLIRWLSKEKVEWIRPPDRLDSCINCQIFGCAHASEIGTRYYKCTNLKTWPISKTKTSITTQRIRDDSGKAEWDEILRWRRESFANVGFWSISAMGKNHGIYTKTLCNSTLETCKIKCSCLNKSHDNRLFLYFSPKKAILK